MNREVRLTPDLSDGAARRVVRNAGYLALADGVNKLMLFVFHLIVARHLGASQLGVLSTALALVTMFAVLTDLGLGALSAREIARDSGSAERLVSNVLAIKSVASAAVILVIVLFVHLVGYPSATIRVVYICSLFVLESAITAYYCWVFQGFERMELAALARTVQTIILVIGAVLISRGSAAVERYALLYVSTGFVSVLFSAAISTMLVRPRIRFSFREWHGLLRASGPIGLAVTFTMFYYWNGTTLLAKLAGNEAVGRYSVALRLVMGLAFAGLALSGAVYPLLSRLFVSDPGRSTRALEVTARYILMLTVPVAVYLSVYARSVTSTLYGSDFTGAASVLRILAYWGVFACLNSLFSNFFMSVDRSRVVTAQTASALAANLVLNVILIPMLGAVGAAIALVAAEGSSLVFLVSVQLSSPGRAKYRELLAAALGTLLAIAGSLLVSMLTIHWSGPVAILSGITSYVLLLVLTGCLRPGDWRLLLPNRASA